MIKKLLDKIKSPDSNEPQKLILIDPASLDGSARPEPDLRVIGMFCDIQEEKVAEVIHAMLYLNEMNRLDSKNVQPIDFYLSTYLGLI